MSDTAPALDHILALLQREITTEQYDAIRAQWFAHVDNEENLFVPHTDAEGAQALDAVMATMSDDCEFRLPTGESWKGQANVRAFYENFLTTFENMVWAPQAVVIGPQGVLDVAEMTANQRKPFGPLVERVGSPIKVLWVIHWPWDPHSGKFSGELVYSLQYLT
jgi:ketosteroid isomerase-like protein